MTLPIRAPPLGRQGALGCFLLLPRHRLRQLLLCPLIWSPSSVELVFRSLPILKLPHYRACWEAWQVSLPAEGRLLSLSDFAPKNRPQEGRVSASSPDELIQELAGYQV